MRKLTDKEARSGYVKEFGFNHNWKEQKAICGYEHCIELMPVEIPRKKGKSCPIFGHNCPSGKSMIAKCIIGKKKIVPIERIAPEYRDFFGKKGA